MMTASQKILAQHAQITKLSEGEYVRVPVDLALGNDITAPVAIQEFRNAKMNKVFEPDKIALVMDHFTPNKNVAAAEQCKTVREFAKEMGIKHFYEGGRVGVEHVILPEFGLVAPGDLIIGADSHTCTYGALGAFATGVGSTDLAVAMATGSVWLRVPAAIQVEIVGKFTKWCVGKDLVLHLIGLLGVDGALYQSLEFTGEGLAQLTLDDRFTICNMAIECGAKNAFFPVCDEARDYLKTRLPSGKKILAVEADSDAVYNRKITIDLSQLEPTLAFPHLPDNVRTLKDSIGVTVDQVVIGSCTNGRISDLRQAAALLKGHKVADSVRAILLPGSPEVLKQALNEGLIDIFVDANVIVGPCSCGPCLGGHLGILAAGERAISTTNRNFVGRMGHPKSEVILASPSLAAAAAIAGQIVDPGTITQY